ncbi:MAG: uncharacterized protein JWN37_727 [Candidatus Nomurabacteria bacterium]|nr:uncharacterized protein [Candidatus Nomurabacteria bacterium]
MKVRLIKNLAASFMLVFLGGCWDMGEGEKIGSITRLQKTGVFCKTWEGEIIRGGLNSGSGVVGSAFHFTVESEELAQQVQKAMETQQEVKIHYRKEAVTLCRSDSENYFLTKIEHLGTVAVPPPQSKEVTGIAPPAPSGNGLMQELLIQNRLLIQNQTAALEEIRKQREGADPNRHK